MSKPGLYIHIPFCRSKCGYCSFYSIPERKLVPEFIGALCREMGMYSNAFPEFDTVYFGGGTPSVLDCAELGEILQAIHDTFTLSPGYECTIEANPTGLDYNFLVGLRGLGFNRLNIGAQSFNDGILRYLGRLHDAKTARQAFTEARRSGFENVGLDLIYGVPGQDMECWMESLGEAVALAPEHLSCYQLTVEEGTPLGRRLAQNEIELPGEDLQYELFTRTSRFLERNGYVHYEISNFARGLEFISRHNCKYWVHTPYLGLGPSAHSFSGKQRWWNHSDVRKYIDMATAGKCPRMDSEVIGPAETCLEMLGLGLRTREGIRLRDFEQARGKPFDRKEQDFLQVLCDEGYTIFAGGRLRPTLKGMAVADHLAAELAAFLDPA